MIAQIEQTQPVRQGARSVRVVVIEPENAVRSFLDTALRLYGYEVHEAATGQEGIFQIMNLQPDLILLDMDLPDVSGLAITRIIRQWSEMPILILSAHDQDMDKIEVLDAGADDYIVKPFHMGELMARMRAALRHIQRPMNQSVFSCGGLMVDLAARCVQVRDRRVALTPTEYTLLRALVNHAGMVMTHQQLWQAIRHEDGEAEPHLLRVHMSNLRRKLERDPTNPQFILTEPGVGYRLRSSST